MLKSALHELDQTQREKIAGFLISHPVGVIAGIDTEGKPYASTVYFSVDHELNLRFTTKRDTFKYKNLLQNPQTMFVVFDAAQQAAVQISGLAQQENDPEAVQAIYHGTLHAAQVTGEDTVPPVAKISLSPYAAFTIRPEYVVMSEYGWGDNFAKALQHADDPESYGDPA